MISAITSLKLEPKLLSSIIMYLYKAFHLEQNLKCKSKGVRGRGLKALWKWATKNGGFVFIFDIYYAAWKIVKYTMSYTDMHHWYNFFLNLSSLRILTGKKHLKIKLQCLRKIGIWTFGSLEHKINLFKRF